MSLTITAPVDVAPEEEVPVSDPAPAPRAPRSRLAQLVRRPTFVVSVAILAFWVVAAISWQALGFDPYGRASTPLQPPQAAFPLGTDYLGRDVLSRVLAGSSSALVVGPLGAIVATILGATLGLIAGYARGVTDTLLTRLFDVLTVLPSLLFIVVLVGAFGVSGPSLILIIGIVFAPGIARNVRAATLAEMGRSYVVSARLLGDRAGSIITRELLPNVLPTILIQATLSLAAAIFMSASLSFLGLGSAPPSPDWGLAINENRLYLQSAWWTVLAPTLAVASVVIATHLLADNLSEVSE